MKKEDTMYSHLLYEICFIPKTEKVCLMIIIYMNYLD